ncbi:MAG: phosphocarrier protein HPr [Clostridiales bacterium]|nr:phosphocarrier protein HPr [Clostridiales bacterium]
MKSIIVSVPFEEGLHARPASEVSKLCQSFTSDVKFINGDIEANPKSTLGLLTLGATKGTEIKVEISGDDEAEALKAIEEFFQRKDLT